MEVAIVSGPTGVQPAVLTPRQQIASVPYALVARSADAVASPAGEPPIPIGAIILWDQAAGCDNVMGKCPCGFEEETAFRGMTIRGADTGNFFPGIPNEPGGFQGTPEGTGAYGDQLTIAEMPAHDHPGSGTSVDGEHQHAIKRSGAQGGPIVDAGGNNNTADMLTQPAGDHSHDVTVTLQGGAASHYHPFRTVLFCRKQQ
jgi:hypothetical protein